jgi:thiosulfate dehydrogenase [quinone] large subunit
MWSLRRTDGSIAAGWYLLPLRLFLGVTFVFAGLQKLANPDFFKASSPTSIHAQLVGAAHTSPIGSLLGHLTGAASGIGALIAVAEVAIGVGALLGLLTRVAAVGGMLVSFSLFLAISFHSRPYFTGSDIVFLFAWTPFVLAGAAGAPALDTWLADRPAPLGASADGPREGAVSRGAVIGIVAAGSAVLIGAVAGLGRAVGSGTRNAADTTTTTLPPTTTSTAAAPTSTVAGGSTSTSTAPLPKGTSIGPATQVPVGGSAAFNDPTSGDPSLVIQQTADDFKAFDAICPHAGCTVAYQASAGIIACPCHGSEFNAKTGAVIQGPATSGLTPIKVIKGSNGDLYVV